MGRRMSRLIVIKSAALAIVAPLALGLAVAQPAEASSIKLTSKFDVVAVDTSTPPPAGLVTATTVDMTPVPEPATLLLFGAGLFVLAAERRRRTRKKTTL